MRSILTLFCLFALTCLQAQPMAYFDYKVFSTIDQQTYVETYIDFSSSSLNYRELPNGKYQAKVGATLAVQKNGVIVSYSKTEILSPEDIDSVFTDFLNLQRFNLPPGNYELEIELVDLYKTENNSVNFKQALVVFTPPAGAYISDIVFLGDVKLATTPGPYTKGNQDMFPLVTDYFPQEIGKLMFYAELYNTKKTFTDSVGAFVFLYKISNPKNGQTFRSYQKLTRQKAGDIIPVLANIEIGDLPSGNYDLNLEIRTTTNELVYASKRDFKRNNIDAPLLDTELDQLLLDNSFVGKLTSLDSLAEYIYCLRPIASEREKQTIDKQNEILNTLDLKKKFFYAFWANKNPFDPSTAWQDYKIEVNLVNKIFSTRIKKGYETDRGRVYLEYGPPNTRTERPTEPSSYPYEIWHYYKIKQFSNKKFVFWNQDLVSNDYELLHSDLFGEIRNQNWQNYLSKRNSPIDNPDKRKPDGQFGGNSDDFFKSPR